MFNILIEFSLFWGAFPTPAKCKVLEELLLLFPLSRLATQLMFDEAHLL